MPSRTAPCYGVAHENKQKTKEPRLRKGHGGDTITVTVAPLALAHPPGGRLFAAVFEGCGSKGFLPGSSTRADKGALEVHNEAARALSGFGSCQRLRLASYSVSQRFFSF